MIRLSQPTINEEEVNQVQEVLKTGFLVQGPKVASFEKKIASFLGVKHAIAVSNCTAALHLSLLALDVGWDDIIILPAYSWLSTANVVELCGAHPVFVDIDPYTANMDPFCLERVITDLFSLEFTKQRVKALIPVYTFGNMSNIVEINEIAEMYGIPVIEDAACALGALLKGRFAGSWGVTGCFSFHPRKIMTTGEGGMVVTDDDSIAKKTRALRNHGIDPESPKTDFIIPGFNYRMTDFQAALGIAQWEKYPGMIARRKLIAAKYNQLLADTNIIVPFSEDSGGHVFQSYIIQLPERIIQHRDEIINKMSERGIETNIGTWHMPMTRYFRTRYAFQTGDFPVTDRVAAASLALPIHDMLSEGEQTKIVQALISCIEEYGSD